MSEVKCLLCESLEVTFEKKNVKIGVFWCFFKENTCKIVYV